MDEVTEQKTLSGFGVRLKKAREALRLSQRDAAARLHLNVRVIQILETEDFKNAPPATFMRGYMKSYSRLLDIPEEEVTIAFEQIGLGQPEPTGTSITTPLLSIGEYQNNKWYLQWANYVLALMLIGLAGIWWTTRAHYSSEKLSQFAMQQLSSLENAASPTQQTQTPAATAPTVAKPVVSAPQPPTPTAAEATIQPVAPTQPTIVAPTPATIPASPDINAATKAMTQPAPTTVVVAPPVQSSPKATRHRSHQDNMGMILQEPGLESDGNPVNNTGDY